MSSPGDALDESSRDRESRVRAIVETVLDGIITIDGIGTVETFNPAAERIFGYGAREVIGNNIKMLMPEPYYGEHDGYLQNYLGTGTAKIIGIGREVVGQRKDSSTFPMELSVSEMEVSGKRMFTGIVRDITDRKRVEAEVHDSESRVRAILDTVLDGIITIDHLGTVETFNPAAANIFEYAPDEVIGRNVRMLMPEPYHGEHDGYLQNYLGTSEAKIIGIGREVVGQRKDGSTFPMDLAVSEMEVSGKRMFTGIVRDITERKQAEKQKQEFISTVSHELRTPLTSIKGSLGLIRTGATGEIPDKLKKMLDIAYNNSERLIRLINDILDVEKIAAGKMEFSQDPLDLGALLDEVIDANKGYGDEHNIRFILTKGSEDAVVRGDYGRLMQVMANLLSNAAKFSPKGETVEIVLSGEGDSFRVAVSDHGPGIPEEFKAKIFSKFSQVDSSDSRSMGGTGLGLNITKAIVEHHGGEIGFESTPGEGATFHFVLPALKVIEDMDAPVLADSGHRRILICEDEPDMAAFLEVILQQAGYETDIAYTAAEAEKKLGQRVYAAMTMDLVLPDKNGITLMKELRARPEFRDLPIIVVSARAVEGQTELSGEAVGVIDWLEKPIDIGRLSQALHKAVDSSTNGGLRILHIEDDSDVLDVVSGIIGDLADVTTVTTLKQAKKILLDHTFDLIILDLMLPDGDGGELFSLMAGESHKMPPVIVFSALESSDRLAGKIHSALVKSHTPNEILLETIRAAIEV